MAVYEPTAATTPDAAAIVRECIESGSSAMLLDEGATPPQLFDLSTGFAGDLVHRLTLYSIPLAVVVSDLTAHSVHFQDFAREANRGRLFRFMRSRAEAIAWLALRDG